ncbi:MAG: hypothetical protein J5716_01700 [Alphaproteobacteria bacterium]|nr:hypothetical protein [Alphaproteobacteria bacterium]
MIIKCDPPVCPFWAKGVGYVGCGHCPKCLSLKRLEWSIRIDAEARCHEKNCFLTLTYDDEYLPESLSLDRIQRFWKSFRKDWQIRYFCAGEYGDKFERPHYHIAAFGIDRTSPCFSDMVYDSKKRVWRGKLAHWPDGFVAVGSLTPASAQYIAKYILKRQDLGFWAVDVTEGQADLLFKMYGDHLPYFKGARWFKDIPVGKEAEFQVMSRRPGIGYPFLAKYGREMLARDSYVLDGKKVPIPQYFKQKILTDAERAERAEQYFLDCTKQWSRDFEAEFYQNLRLAAVRKSLFGKKGALDDKSKDSDQNDRLFMLDNPSLP